eukprot:g32781.t1
MAELLEMAKKDQAHQVEVQEEVEPEMEPTSDEREEKQAFDFDGWTQELWPCADAGGVGMAAARSADMVSWCVSLVYGFPAFGFGAATVMISLFLPALYVDRLGVPLSHIGFVTTAVQLFDAVTDPLMGYLSDRAVERSRWQDRAQFSSGRRRPFMLLGSWSLAASFVALFAPPKEGAGTALAWATTFALLTQLGLTCARVPWLAWGIELTNEYDKKTRLAPGAVSAMNSTGATIFLMAAAFNFYFDGTRFTWKMWMDVVAVFVMMSVYATRAYYQPQKILLIGVLFISVTGFFALKPGCHSVMKNHSLGITVRRLLVPKNFNRVVF